MIETGAGELETEATGELFRVASADAEAAALSI